MKTEIAVRNQGGSRLDVSAGPREVSHRLMMMEAVERRLVTPGNVVRKLARRPDAVRQLVRHEGNVEAIPAMGIFLTP